MHTKGVLFLISSLALFFIAYQFYKLGIDVVSYHIGDKVFGASTLLGVFLTLAAGFLLGFFFYIMELVQIKRKYLLIRELRRRRLRDL